MTLDAALDAIRRGLIVGVPTDTVYGVAVDPANPEAVRRLFDLKGRGYHMPLAVLVASFEQVESLIQLAPSERRFVEPYWPGAFTAVLRWRRALAEGVGDHHRGTLGVRMPDHPTLTDLLNRSGPLAVTSANRSGSPPALDAAGARRVLGDGVAVYLDGRCHGGHASTVVDLTCNPPRVLRHGPVDLDPG